MVVAACGGDFSTDRAWLCRPFCPSLIPDDGHQAVADSQGDKIPYLLDFQSRVKVEIIFMNKIKLFGLVVWLLQAAVILLILWLVYKLVYSY